MCYAVEFKKNHKMAKIKKNSNSQFITFYANTPSEILQNKAVFIEFKKELQNIKKDLDVIIKNLWSNLISNSREQREISKPLKKIEERVDIYYIKYYHL